MVDLSAALAEPSCLSLVSNLIEAAVLPCHKDTTFICGRDGQDVSVVGGDGEEWVREQLHCTRHAVIQPCNKKRHEGHSR